MKKLLLCVASDLHVLAVQYMHELIGFTYFLKLHFSIHVHTF